MILHRRSTKTIGKSNSDKSSYVYNEEKLNKLKKEHCKECRYLAKKTCTAKKGHDKCAWSISTCDYLLVEGHSRGYEIQECPYNDNKEE